MAASVSCPSVSSRPHVKRKDLAVSPSRPLFASSSSNNDVSLPASPVDEISVHGSSPPSSPRASTAKRVKFVSDSCSLLPSSSCRDHHLHQNDSLSFPLSSPSFTLAAAAAAASSASASSGATIMSGLTSASGSPSLEQHRTRARSASSSRVKREQHEREDKSDNNDADDEDEEDDNMGVFVKREAALHADDDDDDEPCVKCEQSSSPSSFSSSPASSSSSSATPYAAATDPYADMPHLMKAEEGLETDKATEAFLRQETALETALLCSALASRVKREGGKSLLFSNDFKLSPSSHRQQQHPQQQLQHPFDSTPSSSPTTSASLPPPPSCSAHHAHPPAPSHHSCSSTTCSPLEHMHPLQFHRPLSVGLCSDCATRSSASTTPASFSSNASSMVPRINIRVSLAPPPFPSAPSSMFSPVSSDYGFAPTMTYGGHTYMVPVISSYTPVLSVPPTSALFMPASPPLAPPMPSWQREQDLQRRVARWEQQQLLHRQLQAPPTFFMPPVTQSFAVSIPAPASASSAFPYASSATSFATPLTVAGASFSPSLSSVSALAPHSSFYTPSPPSFTHHAQPSLPTFPSSSVCYVPSSSPSSSPPSPPSTSPHSSPSPAPSSFSATSLNSSTWDLAPAQLSLSPHHPFALYGSQSASPQISIALHGAAAITVSLTPPTSAHAPAPYAFPPLSSSTPRPIISSSNAPRGFALDSAAAPRAPSSVTVAPVMVSTPLTATTNNATVGNPAHAHALSAQPVVTRERDPFCLCDSTGLGQAFNTVPLDCSTCPVHSNLTRLQ